VWPPLGAPPPAGPVSQWTRPTEQPQARSTVVLIALAIAVLVLLVLVSLIFLGSRASAILPAIPSIG
jgi:hypothetical protein